MKRNDVISELDGLADQISDRRLWLNNRIELARDWKINTASLEVASELLKLAAEAIRRVASAEAA